MRTLGVLALAALASCSAADPGAVEVDATEVAPTTGNPDDAKADGLRLPVVTCAGTPLTGPPGSWRHSILRFLATGAGSANHRGIDLLTSAGTTTQHLTGEIRYGLTDKSLEDEQVELYACRAGAWQRVGSALTDKEGRFDLALRGAARLPIGRRPLYVSVVGDRSGASFVAVVAPDARALVVSDMDGTLIDGENTFATALVTGAAIAPRPGAVAALKTLASKGYLVVYMSSRGRLLQERSRRWLIESGFPAGVVRHAASAVTLPGAATTDYKATTLAALLSSGLAPAVGFGNRATDAAAYLRANIERSQIFLQNSEFAAENRPVIARGDAVGFTSYTELLGTLRNLPSAP